MMRSRSFTTGFALAGLVGAAILMALCVNKGEAAPSTWFWLLTTVWTICTGQTFFLNPSMFCFSLGLLTLSSQSKGKLVLMKYLLW